MKIAVIIALLLPIAASAQIETVLNFSDGSIEICQSTGWSYSPGLLNVQVVSCEPDEIFKNGFEP